VIVLFRNRHMHTVECQQCFARGPIRKTVIEAIDVWNGEYKLERVNKQP
jgi:hypothetical protein